jgi:hypothetical protein
MINAQIQIHQELRADLQEYLSQFERYRMLADINGMIAVAAQTVLVPANMIINASPGAGKARTLAHRLGKLLYDKFAASGTRVESEPAQILGQIKNAVLDELRRKGATEWLPAVRTLAGLAEDSLALIETLQMVSEGNAQSEGTRHVLEAQVAKVRAKIMQLQSQRADLLCDSQSQRVVRMH